MTDLTTQIYTPEIAPEWDAFCALQPDAWWWHTTDWMAYAQDYDSDAMNLSVAIRQDDRIVAVCPFMIDQQRTVWGGQMLPTPVGCGPHALAAAWVLLAHLPNLHSVTVILQATRTDVGLLSAGWGTTTARMRTLDLTGADSDLWRGVRHSYRSVIHRMEEQWQFVVDPGDGSLNDTYEAVHCQANGRRVRSHKTFAHMKTWLQRGNGVLVGAVDPSGTWGGFLYAIVYKDRAYYASGPTLVDDVAKGLQWTMIKTLKAHGVKAYELGWQGLAHDDKGRGVEHFKAAWGGQDYPRLIIRSMPRAAA